MSNTKKYWNLFLFLLSNILFCLEHPNFININGFGFLAWVSYIPILFLIRNISLKQSWMIGFLYGLSSFSLFSFWLVNHSMTALGFSLLLCGLEYSLFFFLLKYEDVKSLKYGWFFQFFIACTFEYLKTKTFLGNSYGLIGYSQWRYIKLIQIVDIIGIYGFSFFIMFPSFFIYGFIKKLLDRKTIKNNRDADNQIYECTTHINYISKYEIQLKSTSVLLPVFLCIIWCIGFYFVFDYGNKIEKIEYKANETKKIALIQHNPTEMNQSYEVYKNDFIKLMKLTDEASEMYSDVDLFVWPETAIVPDLLNYSNMQKDQIENQLIQNILNYIKSKNTPIVLGNSHTIIDSEDNKKSYNSALFFNDNLEPQIYSKNHLVPMSEYIPYISNFEKLNVFFNNHNMNLWTPGKEINIFNLDNFNFSTPICFEDTFPDVPRKMVRNGSRCFINISNDSWGKSKVCQNQHLSMSVFRAVENKIPVVKCSSSGATCFINRKGVIELMAENFSPTYICHTVDVITDEYKPTFFTRYGDIAGFSSFILCIVLLLIQIFIGIINKTNNKSQVVKNG